MSENDKLGLRVRIGESSHTPRIGTESLASQDAAPKTIAGIDGGSAAACAHVRTAIKRGAVFVVAHSDGLVHGGCTCGQGIYAADTRHVSVLIWHLGDRELMPLDCDTDSGVRAVANFLGDQLPGVRAGTLHVRLQRDLEDGVQDAVTVTNYGRVPVTVTLALELAADFRDMFDVRAFAGVRATGGGQVELAATGAILSYQGADDVLRETCISLEPAPVRLEPARCGLRAEWDLELAGRQPTTVTVDLRLRAGSADVLVRPTRANKVASAPDLHAGQAGPDAGPTGRRPAFPGAHESALAQFAEVRSSNPVFDRLLRRGTLDLLALLSPTPEGAYFAAGIPWYACPFGRDGLITAFGALPLTPEPAIGTLRYLARRQGTRHDEFRDEEPGKILHEMRQGELSLSGEVPFAPSFCTADATPLWLVLLHETWKWTGDSELVRELWPNALAAIAWLDRFGHGGGVGDGNGFVTYQQRGARGLSNQGWKDSWDSVQHPDGSLAEGPIALVEIQGYAYDARRRAAKLADILGDRALGARLRDQAAALRARFHDRFWHPESGYLALAIDGHGRRVVSEASNPGHCLWSGILDEPITQAVADRLLGPGLFSGWGIRTLSADSPNFNPVSYHNGSVWPHDNGLIGAGLARCGYKEQASRVLEALLAASEHFDLGRLPELFCGFARTPGTRPVPYPVSCSPQAWAAGTPVMLLRALLGLEADASIRVLQVSRPHLPAWAGTVRLSDLRVGDASVDLEFESNRCRVLARRGEIEVVVGA